MFRLDRMEQVELLDEPADPPPDVQLRDLAEGVYQPAAEHLLAVLRRLAVLCLGARLLPDRVGGRRPRPGCEVSLRVADPAWVRALVLGSGGAWRCSRRNG